MRPKQTSANFAASVCRGQVVRVSTIIAAQRLAGFGGIVDRDKAQPVGTFAHPQWLASRGCGPRPAHARQQSHHGVLAPLPGVAPEQFVCAKCLLRLSNAPPTSCCSSARKRCASLHPHEVVEGERLAPRRYAVHAAKLRACFAGVIGKIMRDASQAQPVVTFAHRPQWLASHGCGPRPAHTRKQSQHGV